MSRDSEDFDVQPADETDLLTDPDWLRYSARNEGEAAHANGVSLLDTFRSFVRRGATKDEIDAAVWGWNRAALFSLAKGANIPLVMVKP